MKFQNFEAVVPDWMGCFCYCAFPYARHASTIFTLFRYLEYFGYLRSLRLLHHRKQSWPRKLQIWEITCAASCLWLGRPDRESQPCATGSLAWAMMIPSSQSRRRQSRAPRAPSLEMSTLEVCDNLSCKYDSHKVGSFSCFSMRAPSWGVLSD